ncbi:MAG: hypothetical protein ABFQ53_03395 [Patescibacteria group bacterium]
MKNFVNKKILLSFLAVILLSGCVDFDTANFDPVVEQPATTDSGDTISIVAHVIVNDAFAFASSEELPREELFVPTHGKIGVLLPDNWSIEGNTVTYTSVNYNGTGIYDEFAVADLNVNHPAPAGYYWWAATTENASPGGTESVRVDFNIMIDDNASGDYELDYFVGDYTSSLASAEKEPFPSVSPIKWSKFENVPISVSEKEKPKKKVVVPPTEEDDLISGSLKRKFKKYKETFKNKKSRDAYKEVKKWKKGTPEEVAKYYEIKAIYEKYKHLSKKERKLHLTPEEYEKFQQYRRYKGYKEYKKLREKVK